MGGRDHRYAHSPIPSHKGRGAAWTRPWDHACSVVYFALSEGLRGVVDGILIHAIFKAGGVDTHQLAPFDL